MNLEGQHEEEPKLYELQAKDNHPSRIEDAVDRSSYASNIENEENITNHILTSEVDCKSHNVPKVHFADARREYSFNGSKPAYSGLKSCLKKSRTMQDLNFIEGQLIPSRKIDKDVDHLNPDVQNNTNGIPHSLLHTNENFDPVYLSRNRNFNCTYRNDVTRSRCDRRVSEIGNKIVNQSVVIPSNYEFQPITSNAIRPLEVGIRDNYQGFDYPFSMSNFGRRNIVHSNHPTMRYLNPEHPSQVLNQTSNLSRLHYQNQLSPSLQTSLSNGLYYHNHDESLHVSPVCPRDPSYQEEEILTNISNSDIDEDIRNLIETIKNDIQDMTERHEHVEIEKNQYLIRELEDILSIYKMTFDKETDILSDVASTSSFHSATTEATAHGTQISPSLTPSSTNLSKASDCSSSPCLTSDNDFIDEDRSTSSSDGKYDTPPDWTDEATAVLRSKSSSAPVLKNQPLEVNKQARSQSDPQLDGEYINMSIRIKEYKFFRSLSVKVNDNWPIRKAEQLWRQLRTHKIAEIEAAEACKWLRATGFPQYAQMYEDMQFPVDISTAAQDHPRLDPDVLNALYRRIQILNNCVHLYQQKIPHNTDESEDENYALSKNWTFQSDIRRWSRACITEPNAEGEILKSTKKTTESEDSFEDNSGAPKERIRRGGSVKFRRRREGVIISENGAKLLDSLSEQLSGISVASSLNHASDSELTPKFYNRLWKKPSEEESQRNISENRIAFCETPPKDEQPTVSYCKFSSHQLGQLEKIAMLKLTAYIEKYCPTHRTGWNWEVPKNLIRKMKNPVYKDKAVFGVPIQLTLQRTGHPLPRNIEVALEWLQRNAVDQVGLFRKSGVKSRIQSLRNTVETSNELLSFEDLQAYDVADMVKQYFRELPEALLTNKLSETFKLIFQYVPNEQRLEAVLCGIFLMPDEHVEVLQILITFLVYITKHSDENQMNASNLATCFAPSLFHYSTLSKSNFGSPHPKELAENKAAHDCLLFFLENHEFLFTIPQGLINQCNPVEMKEWKVLDLAELGKDMGGWKEYLNECEQAHLKEVRDKSRGWTLLPNLHSKVEVYFKKIEDGLSVRVWKAIADIDAPPSEVMHRILRERHIWDLELESTKIVAQLEKSTEIFQYSRKRISSLPVEEYCVVRRWKSGYPKGSCLIVETSVEHEEIIHIPGSIKGIVHASRYYIEPCGSGRSRIYHMCRTDTMGRKPEYYYKNYGHIIGVFISNLQNSFYQQTTGPESKV